MSILISDNYNDGSFSLWKVDPGVFPHTTPLGCGYTNCYVCSTANIYQDFAASSAGTLRQSMAYLNNVGLATPIIATVVDFINNSNPFQLVFAFVDDVSHTKALYCRVSSLSGSTFHYSADNVIPEDGTWFGFETTWTISGGSVTVNVYINGTNILTVTEARPWIADQWTRIRLLTYRFPDPGVDPIATGLIAVDNTVVENVVNYTNYQPCSAPQLLGTYCQTPPPPPSKGSLTIGKVTYPYDPDTEFEIVVGDGTIPPLGT